MCFNLIAISKKRNLLILLPDLIEKMFQNPHGYFLYTKSKYLRALEKKEYVKTLVKELIANKEIHVHFRMASSGSINLQNIHGWKISDEEGNEFYISHNGFVLEYGCGCSPQPYAYYTWRGREIKVSLYEEADSKSDTYKLVHDKEFIRYLIDRDFERLYHLLDNKGFVGVMLINSKDFKEVYGISQMKSIKVYRTKDTVILSNEELDLKNMEFEQYENCVITIKKDLDIDIVYLEDIDRKERKTLKTHSFSFDYADLDIDYRYF